MAGKGLFVVTEGLDGSGKTTLLESIQIRLEAKGITDLVRTREPGGSSIGYDVRRIMLSRGDLDSKTQLMLMMADRIRHVKELIEPSLKAGKLVLCDRYIESSMVYQGYGGDIPPDEIRWILDWGIEGLYPDLTIYCMPSEEERLRRLYTASGGELDGIESNDREYFKRARKGLEGLIKEKTPDQYVLIDETLDVDAAADMVISRILELRGEVNKQV